MFDHTTVTEKVRDLTSLREFSVGEHNQDDDDEPLLKFYCEPEDYGAFPPPVPGHEALPDWFKSVPRELENGDLSAKACQPMYDAMSSGWILRTPAEMEVKVFPDDGEIATREKVPWISTQTNHLDQLGDDFFRKDVVLFQFRTPWTVVTREGYSLMVLPPLNRPDPRFQSFAGIIDTDEYPRKLNMVCMWTLPQYQGMIERGAPIATLLPVKREELGGTAEVRPKDDEFKLKEDRYNQLIKSSHKHLGYQKEVWDAKPTQTNDYEEDEYKP